MNRIKKKKRNIRTKEKEETVCLVLIVKIFHKLLRKGFFLLNRSNNKCKMIVGISYACRAEK